ncbi:unnamed protein product [Adineta steineri]|uniref:EF-hand domain-containing protein n=1 Tax=Adineta steineri TaxID=433720 RepID=A0A816AHP2_9BILA|nr:unnamed protein product [Adineta steineri]CAF1596334.1 unnamed protein product [Adineta steineri]
MTKHNVHKRVHRRNGRIDSLEFDFTEPGHLGSTSQTVKISRDQYEQSKATNSKLVLSFDEATDVLNVFMKGSHATPDEISAVFSILDKNKSGDISVREIAAFTRIIAPNFNKETVFELVSIVDSNDDDKMNLTEFTIFIKKNLGRKVALNRH